MKLMVLTAGVFPTSDAAYKRMPMLRKSCEKYGIDLHVYGIGFPHFPSWCELKIKMQLDYIEANHGDFTHVLYTDARDSFFCGPMDELLEKYRPYQDVMMVSCGKLHRGGALLDQLYLPEVYGDKSTCGSDYVYPHVGGYIGPIDLVIKTKRRMWQNSVDRIDDMVVWHEAWVDGYFRPQRDLDCDIFQVMDYNIPEDDLEIRNGRLYNRSTISTPCIVHFTGGYSRPEEGLAKPERLLPWWEKIHPELPIA